MEHTLLSDSLIIQYRNSIQKRYQFKIIKQEPTYPPFLTQESMEKFRTFFLAYLYALPADRIKLDESFQQLEGYVSSPQKVLGILSKLTFSIFKFGSSLPAALMAGKAALKTYHAARKFEQQLLENALAMGFSETISEKEFMRCLKSLPKESMLAFIQDLGSLFNLITTPDLLRKTIEMMQDVLKIMQSKPAIYQKEDLQAIELGLDIFTKGEALLQEYSLEEKKTIVNFIMLQEKAFIASW